MITRWFTKGLLRETVGFLAVILLVIACWSPDPTTANSPVASPSSQTSPVHVVSPNGGERIPAGSMFTITWTIEAGTPVFGQNIFLSTDGGDSFELITLRMLDPTVRSYDWQVPNIETTRARIQVLAPNMNALNHDESDANFTIFRPNTPPTQENITLRGTGIRNRLMIRTPAARFTSPVTGFIDLAFSPTEDPATLLAQLTALSFVGESLTIGEGPTGPLLFAKEHTTFARGTFDLATGDFRIPVSVALIYDRLLSDNGGISTGDRDARNSPRPILFSGLLTGRRNPQLSSASGTLEGTIQGNVPLLNGARVTIDWSGRLAPGNTIAPTAFCPTFCIDAKVIADDTVGTEAVVTPGMLESRLAEVNATWAQGAMAFTLRDTDPATPGPQVTFIAASTMVSDASGRVLTDGNLRQITDQGAGLTDEEVALTSLSRSQSCIDVYFIDQLVGADGTPSPETGLTRNSGMGSAAIILATSGLSESDVGMALAHQLGHALGLTHDAVPGSNAMFADGIGGLALNASQCLTAAMVNPLATRDSCRDRFFDPFGLDVVIRGLNGPDAVVRGIDVTTTIVGRGLAGAQAVEFPSSSEVSAQILSSSDTTVMIRLMAARDATRGPVRFFIRTPNGTASSGVITFDVR